MTHLNNKHDRVICPRCGTVYECKIGSINLCQCTSAQLTQEQREYISSLYQECLCTGCLMVLQAEYDLPEQ